MRAWVLALGVATATLGAWAFFFPQGFFDDFPVEGAYWVSTLGEFNDHLMRDFGAAEVGLGVAAILVALNESYPGIVAVMAGFVVFGVLHLGYHFTVFGLFPPFSAGSQAVALALFVAIPLMVLRTTYRKEET